MCSFAMTLERSTRLKSRSRAGTLIGRVQRERDTKKGDAP
jgi:hypothetical protein